MENRLVRRPLRGWAVAALAAVVLGGTLAFPAQQPRPDQRYYRRTAIDTSASHADTDPAVRKWLDDTYAYRPLGPDLFEYLTLQGKGHNYEGSVWRIQPAAGKASWRKANGTTMEATWTVPPEYLTAGQPFTVSISVTNPDSWWAGARLWESPVERFEPGAEKTVAGKSPFAGVTAIKDTPSQTGSITLVPKRNAGKFTLGIFLDGSYDLSAHYHYEPTDTVPPGRSEPPGRPDPPRPTGCARTFAKEWTANWGQFTVHLDGNRASGTYTNRDGKNGPGTFTGTVAGNTLDARWKDDRGAWEGTFRIVLGDDGCSFSNTGFTINPTPPTGPGNGPTGTDTGGSPPPGGGGGGGGGTDGPAFDPGGQDCIDQWIRLAMSIRNRRDKSDPAPNGPWRVSEYGQLVGHGVKPTSGPPDDWETTYRRNRYAYIWANWQQTHTLPEYGGELPPLRDFVATCLARKGGGGGPGTTGYPPGTTLATPMTLLAENRKVLAGDVVLVPVWLVNGADVANINFTVAYDGAVARPEGDPGAGNLLGQALFSANPKDVGLIRLGFAQSKGLTGTGTVAYLPFRAVGQPGARTPLHLDVQTLNNPGGTVLTVARVDGSITIVGPDGLVPGDCDGDGELTTIDAKCALDMSVKLIPEKRNMDLDGDGQVTSRDATIVLQRRAMFLARGAK